MTMTTKTRILSGLALTAATLVIVPLSSDEASARALASSGGARSVVRSNTVVLSRARTVPTSAHKLSTTSTSKVSKNNQTAVQSRKLRELEKGNDKDKIGIRKEHP